MTCLAQYNACSKAYQDATRSVPYEMIQLVVTMLGCISVEYYASNLNVILSKNLEGEGDDKSSRDTLGVLTQHAMC